MIIYHSIKDLQEELRKIEAHGLSTCLIPTMGALHKGHMSLILKAKEVADIAICSIFVNPTQFNQKDDLVQYPRTIGPDLRLLDENHCDIVFIPDVEEMYPENNQPLLEANYGPLSDTFEGEKRPGHFNGVVTVVKKFFDIVKPNKACFGLKDFQQISIISRMVKDHNLAIEIIPCPILREESGLAMSSRNMLLSEENKKKAAVIHKVLDKISENIESNIFKVLQKEAIEEIEKSGDFEVEYLGFVDPVTFDVLERKESGKPVVVLFAGWIGGVRLIDNILIEG